MTDNPPFILILNYTNYFMHYVKICIKYCILELRCMQETENMEMKNDFADMHILNKMSKIFMNEKSDFNDEIAL